MISQIAMQNQFVVLDWDNLKSRLLKVVGAVLTGTTLTLRHFDKKDDFTIDAKNLRQLPTVTHVGSASGTITVDSGTDCLVVIVAANGGSLASAALTYNGVGMTVLNRAEQSINGGVRSILLAYLKNPTPGSYTLTTSSGSGTIRMLATCWQGTQASPFRSASLVAVNGSSYSMTPTSSVNDIVIDGCGYDVGGWAPGAGQTQIYNGGSNPFIFMSSKPGASSTTTMSASGSAASGYAISAALIGS